jgi:diguanylate cyclase (GGDEF)-like protein
MPLRRIDLRARMVLLVVLATVPIVAVLAIQTFFIHRDHVSKVFSDATASALKISSYPKEVLPELKSYMANISQLPEMATPENCEPLLKILNPITKVQPYFTHAIVYSAQGYRICPAPDQGEKINIADREYFQRILRNKTYTISGVLIARFTKKESIIFSQPVLDEKGDVKYVINLGLDTQWLRGILHDAAAKANLPNGAVAAIVDDDGIIFASSPDTYGRIADKSPDWEIVHPLLIKSGNLTREEVWLDGVHRATVYAPLFESSNGGLWIRVGIPIEPALSEVKKNGITYSALITLVILFALSTAWFISERLVLKPIHAILLAATSLKNGDFSARVGTIKATGELEELSTTFDSMASQIQKDREQLQFLAMHDPLTGLPNRYWVRERLSQLIHSSVSAQGRVALILLDLNGFKEINDSLGHQLGDKVLIQVARILSNAISGKATSARLGGDEFVIIVEDVQRYEAVEKLAKAIQDQLRRPVIIGEQQFFVSASMGAAVFPEHGEDMDTLMQNADVAMYQAKAEKIQACRFYSEWMNQFSSARLKMQTLLSQAVPRNELVLHYQPKMSAVSGKIIGAEVLVRWKSAELGFISPSDFIPLAEETGLIVEIGEWVLKTACAQLKSWDGQLPDKFSLAINLSPRQFVDPDLISKILNALECSDASVTQLELEITEGALMYNPVRAIEVLSQMRELGAKVSVDDFGTGYSSLGYLKNLPIDALKIDKSFIAGLPNDASDRAIVGAVIAIAKELELRVTAEGVETQEQLEILRTLGCDEIQGYLFSRPLTAANFLTMLHQQEYRNDA